VDKRSSALEGNVGKNFFAFFAALRRELSGQELYRPLAKERKVQHQKRRAMAPISLGSIISAMVFLRFLMMLALVVWLGGLIFFAFVVAPTVFSPGLLPSRHLAGEIVSRSLAALHWMGIVSGIVFLIKSAIYNRITVGSARLLAGRHLLIALMLLLTIISQFAISPKMHALRAQAGVIDNVPPDSPLRIEFNRLHLWSEKFDQGVFVLGFAALFLTARALH
jgi:uncharacterized membrane protein